MRLDVPVHKILWQSMLPSVGFSIWLKEKHRAEPKNSLILLFLAMNLFAVSRDEGQLTK